jgi:hypothetical protein
MKDVIWFISALAGALIVCLAPPAIAGQKHEAGSIDVTYAKRNVQPIAQGHILLLAESTGNNKGGGFDGFGVSIREIADLDKGNGTNSGYVFFTRGDDMQVVKISGKVSTAMKDGHQNTTMSGNWEVVDATGTLAGNKGEGTYTGYFTAEDRYHIDWNGSSTGPQAPAK